MSLPRIVNQWASRDVVRGAAVVSEDGLLVHDALAPPADREAVAALAVTVVRLARQLGAAAGPGELRRVVLDLASGPAVLAPLEADQVLVVLAQPDRDIGPLLFDIRHSRAALSRAI